MLFFSGLGKVVGENHAKVFGSLTNGISLGIFAFILAAWWGKWRGGELMCLRGEKVFSPERAGVMRDLTFNLCADD